MLKDENYNTAHHIHHTSSWLKEKGVQGWKRLAFPWQHDTVAHTGEIGSGGNLSRTRFPRGTCSFKREGAREGESRNGLPSPSSGSWVGHINWNVGLILPVPFLSCSTSFIAMGVCVGWNSRVIISGSAISTGVMVRDSSLPWLSFYFPCRIYYLTCQHSGVWFW